MRRRLLSSLVLLLPLLASLPLAAQQGGGLGPRRFMIAGKVRDAVTNQAADGVLVELHVFNGAVVGQVFTSQNGSFDFGILPSDSYTVVVESDGYERINQQIFLTSNMQDVMLELRRKGPDPYAPSGHIVSVRELSIPRKAHDAMEKAVTLFQKTDYPASIIQFARAIKEYPDYYEAYAQMGMTHLKMGDQKTAEETLRKSIAVSKDMYADGMCMLATLLTDQQRFDEAAALARKATELDADMWQGKYELARALYGLDDLEGAETSATAAAELYPDNPETYLVLANIHSHMHDYPKLVDDLNHYLKLNPTGQQAEQARQTREQVRQALARSDASPPASAPTP